MVKVYDDTLASAENANVRIAAGKDKLFMTYGIGTPAPFVNGMVIITNPVTKVMATDHNGKLLWRKKLPDALEMGDVVPLDDGGCLVSAILIFGSNPSFATQNIYLFRFNSMGDQVALDSVMLPSAVVSNYYFESQNMVRLLNGNIMLYGTVYDFNGAALPRKGFALEYNLTGGQQWTQTYSFPPATVQEEVKFSSCISTSDGFLFTGDLTEYDATFQPVSHVFVLKTNTTGTTQWIKFFENQNAPWTRNIISMENGNYCFCFNTEYYQNSKMHVYEINSAGDSVRAAVVSGVNPVCGSVIVPSGDGGVIGLINSFPNVVTTYSFSLFRQINTSYIQFSADLSVNSDMNFQSQTTDFLTTACKTTDGRIFCFGLVQSFERGYYKPELLILK